MVLVVGIVFSVNSVQRHSWPALMKCHATCKLLDHKKIRGLNSWTGGEMGLLFFEKTVTGK
eukprot:1458688-Amphidinium_carterae.1